MAPSNVPSRYPLPHTEETEQYPVERYIFLLLFFVAFSRLVKALKRLRREEFQHDELDMEESSDIGPGEPQDIPPISSRFYPQAEIVHSSTSFITDDILNVHEPSNDDRSQLATLTVPSLIHRHAPSLPTEILQAHRIHHLLTQLQTTISLVQNDPEDDSHARQVKALRRQLAEAMTLDVGRSSFNLASRALLPTIDPPPAYSVISPPPRAIANPVSPVATPS